MAKRKASLAIMSQDYTKRASGIELPGATELLHILTKESPRKAARFDYLATHPELFEAHRKLAELAGVDNEWSGNYANISLDQLVDKITAIHTAMAEYISQHTETSSIYHDVFSALVLNPVTQRSDVIFVFGSMTNMRVEKAVELYNDHVAPKIILSGDGPHYHDNDSTEAERMAEYARNAGVPDEVLILENKSVTLPDNVKRTIDMMEQMNWRPASLIIVATNFVLRRAVMEWYKFTPWDIQIYPVASRTQSAYFSPETWHQNSESIALVLNEYAKLVIESKIDLMRESGEA